MKERTFSVEEIIKIIECCDERATESYCGMVENCPLGGECLYYWTGDDSEMLRRKK